jgi:hypothetical protein
MKEEISGKSVSAARFSLGSPGESPQAGQAKARSVAAQNAAIR